MNATLTYIDARTILLSQVKSVNTEWIPLEHCTGRILASDFHAKHNIPPFDRSPYDGYALRAEDILYASKDNPITLNIIEEIPAGAFPTKSVTSGCAAKILTGAPIPDGADVVVPYEVTSFSAHRVTFFQPEKSGTNIILCGEDVQEGSLLASKGSYIDSGLAGTIASQGIHQILVYKKPQIGLISTGNEVLELDCPLVPGKIHNSNRYTLTVALEQLGCEVHNLGLSGDNINEISALIDSALLSCDAVILTGGVSVGDYDYTPAAMELSGVSLLVQGVDMKPGMACAYGVKDSKLVLGLSGNPASSITNFYAVVMPVIKALGGYHSPIPDEITITLANDFNKKSRSTRFLRGTLDLKDGIVKIVLPKDQGNVVISSTIGCNAFVIVPAGSGILKAGTTLKGFLL